MRGRDVILAALVRRMSLSPDQLSVAFSHNFMRLTLKRKKKKNFDSRK
jgi:hypothetical protein